ncbi:putative phosphatase-domain-containing protein [Geranomyces variabilis]|nr:putative phosphatase-domain-containing protein [Geranomyces variabilis]KAJ3138968.1 hypothetical protein HDU90_000874 [Geranomyces variabilis]
MSATDQQPQPPLLFAFDFDWTLVDEDSDRFIFGELSPPALEKVAECHRTTQWTDLMDELHGDLYNARVPSLTLMDTWRRMPFNPSTAAALRLAATETAANGPHHLVILSDANTVAIDAILKHHGLRDLFRAVITNPARFDNEGRLRVERLIPADGLQHDCANGCAVNICKGKFLTEYIATHGPFTSVIYAGDGKNDLCPAMTLRARDYILPRTGHTLAKLLCPPGSVEAGATAMAGDNMPEPENAVPIGARERVSASIRAWATGEDLLEVVKGILVAEEKALV